MHGSEHKDRRHSTEEQLPPRTSLWPRFLFSLALIGLAVGLMVGQLTRYQPPSLDRIELHPDTVVLLLSAQPRLQAGQPQGTFALLLQAHGAPAQGELTVGGHPAKWSINSTERGLLLNVIAARHLQGSVSGVEEDGHWRLSVSLREE